MKKFLICSAVAAHCLLAAALAQAASFDCSHAGSANEKIICGDPALSAMDDRLGKAFRQARAHAEDKRAFRAQSDVQWRWREDNCHDRACLVQWYGRRQAELEAQAGSIAMAARLPVAVPAAAAAKIAPPAAATTTPAPLAQAAPITPAAMASRPPTALPAAVPAAVASPLQPVSLKLSLSSRQIDGVAPAGASPWPHYARVDNGEYFYEDSARGNALVTVRYYGIERGQHIFEVNRGKQVLRYTCSADCAYIGELALPGDTETDMLILPNDRKSLPSLFVNDALNGLLAQTKVH